MQSSQKVIIGVLGLAVIIVLAMVLMKGSPKTQPPTTTNNNAQTQNNPPAKTYTQPLPSKITVEALQKLILGPNPTPAQVKQISTEVGADSVISPVLDVTGCVATPNIIRVKMNTALTFTNKDAKPHKIYYGQTSYSVPPTSEMPVTLSFSSPGNYAYRCDNSKIFDGMFLVLP